MVALRQMDARLRHDMIEARDVCVLTRARRHRQLAAPPSRAAERDKPRTVRRSIQAVTAALKVQIGSARADEAAAMRMFPADVRSERGSARREKPIVFDVGKAGLDVGGNLRGYGVNLRLEPPPVRQDDERKSPHKLARNYGR